SSSSGSSRSSSCASWRKRKRVTVLAMPDPRLAALADALIPAAGGMPSASEADATGKWIDRALAARPDLAPSFTRALGAGDVKHLQKDDPEAFAALAELVSGAYYMNVKVRKRIGYPGQKS